MGGMAIGRCGGLGCKPGNVGTLSLYTAPNATPSLGYYLVYHRASAGANHNFSVSPSMRAAIVN